jgi:ABC-type oligopeptide transport system ATPase subunit
LRSDGQHSYENVLYQNLANIDKVLSGNDFSESTIRTEVISIMTDDFMKKKLSIVFSTIPSSSKQKVIDKFFRKQGQPSSPIMLIDNLYRQKETNGTITATKIIQKIKQANIDNYINQRKNEMKSLLNTTNTIQL